ncbi:MAG TPA: hypothetical protein PL105_22915, partial [Caldilineaceae bacterium]|nr:hypothetical protein [Caldilineaceae bacterium]
TVAQPAPKQPESAAMESSAPSAMRSAPAVGGIGGGLDSGPMAIQALPANEFPPPESGVAAAPRTSDPNFAAQRAGEPAAFEAAPMDAAPDAPVAEESAADAAPQEEVVVAESVAEPAVEPVAEPLEEAVIEEAPDPQPQSVADMSRWSFWFLAQAALGGLVVLLGIFWLRSR